MGTSVGWTFLHYGSVRRFGRDTIRLCINCICACSQWVRHVFEKVPSMAMARTSWNTIMSWQQRSGINNNYKTGFYFQFSILIEMFVTTIVFDHFAWDLGMTLETIKERSQSRLKFMREQLWYKLLCCELVNPRIKIVEKAQETSTISPQGGPN